MDWLRRLGEIARWRGSSPTPHDPNAVYKNFFKAILDGKLDKVKQIVEGNGGAEFLQRRVDGIPVRGNLESFYNGSADFLRYSSKDGSVAEGGKLLTDRCGVCGVVYAIYSGAHEIAEFLFAQGVSADLKIDDAWNSPLIHLASVYGCVEIVKMMLEKGVNASTVDKHKRSCLHKACPRHTKIWSESEVNDHLQIIDILLNYGASPNVRDELGYTPLSTTATWREGIMLLAPRGKKKFYSASDFPVSPESPICIFMDKLLESGADPYNDSMDVDNAEEEYQLSVIDTNSDVVDKMNSGKSWRNVVGSIQAHQKFLR